MIQLVDQQPLMLSGALLLVDIDNGQEGPAHAARRIADGNAADPVPAAFRSPQVLELDRLNAFAAQRPRTRELGALQEAAIRMMTDPVPFRVLVRRRQLPIRQDGPEG